MRVRQPYQWRTRCDEDVGRCHCIFMLFFLLIQLNPLATLFIQNTAEKENINAEMMLFYVKTETKPFTQNANVSHFLEGHLSLLHSRLAKESRIFRKRFKIIVSSTLKKHVSTLWRDGSLPIPLHVLFLNEKNVTLCDWFSVLCIKLCIYMMLFCF